MGVSLTWQVVQGWGFYTAFNSKLQFWRNMWLGAGFQLS